MSEFILVCRYLEPKKITLDQAIQLFYKLSIREGNLRVITFQGFVVGCVDHNLFSFETQKAWLKIKDAKEVLPMLKDFCKRGGLQLIEKRLQDIGKFDVYYQNWIKPTEELINNPDSEKEPIVLLLRLKLIEQESIRVYQEIKPRLFMGPFNAFIDMLKS